MERTKIPLVAFGELRASDWQQSDERRRRRVQVGPEGARVIVMCPSHYPKHTCRAPGVSSAWHCPRLPEKIQNLRITRKLPPLTLINHSIRQSGWKGFLQSGWAWMLSMLTDDSVMISMT